VGVPECDRKASKGVDKARMPAKALRKKKRKKFLQLKYMYRKEQSFVIYAIKPMGGGGSRRTTALIFRALYGGKCQSSSPGRIIPRKEALYSLNRRNLSPIHDVRFGRTENYLSLSGLETWIVQPSA